MKESERYSVSKWWWYGNTEKKKKQKRKTENANANVYATVVEPNTLSQFVSTIQKAKPVLLTITKKKPHYCTVLRKAHSEKQQLQKRARTTKLWYLQHIHKHIVRDH